jgi:tetraacyldisaccharide 4'-kinase
VLGLDEALEQGTLRVPFSGLLTGAWRVAMTRTLRRNLSWPAHVRVVVIGGATLGGSGKTPLAIACAAELAKLGASTALVGHAHRAAPRFARVVTRRDSIQEVGDEAFVAARALQCSGARVIVGPTRQAAIDLAARVARVLVVDGVSQTAPVAASLALLAVDAYEPWGLRGALPPRGDLRAPRSDLVDVCDVVVAVGDPPDPASAEWRAIAARRDVALAQLAGAGARLASGELVSWEALARTPLGLIAALARPDRVVRSLAARGVRPRVVLRGTDHGPVSADLARRACRAVREAGVALWLATPKCSTHVAHACGAGSDGAARDRLGAPWGALEHELILSAPLAARLRQLATP